MIFWDVQRGTSAYINTPNGTSIVHDLGTGSYKTGDKWFSPLLHLKKSGLEKIDYAIITHPHGDHISDIMNLDGVPPRVMNWPDIDGVDLIGGDSTPGIRLMEQLEEKRGLLEKYLKFIQHYLGAVSPEQNPRFASNNGGVEIQVFTPTPCSERDFNNHSLVTTLSYGHAKVMLTGDNGTPSWEELLERNDFIDSIKDIDILLAPYHGKDCGFHPELFHYFRPKLTIISEGRHLEHLDSAIDRYRQVSDGWVVHKRGGGVVQRSCLTTRKDGAIVVKLGVNPEGGPFIYVSID